MIYTLNLIGIIFFTYLIFSFYKRRLSPLSKPSLELVFLLIHLFGISFLILSVEVIVPKYGISPVVLSLFVQLLWIYIFFLLLWSLLYFRKTRRQEEIFHAKVEELFYKNERMSIRDVLCYIFLPPFTLEVYLKDCRVVKLSSKEIIKFKNEEVQIIDLLRASMPNGQKKLKKMMFAIGALWIILGFLALQLRVNNKWCVFFILLVLLGVMWSLRKLIICRYIGQMKNK